MKLRTVMLQERTINVGLIRPKFITVPAQEHTYAPTLATVHNWLYDQSFGPFVLSWRDGLLCPFHSQVWQKNITCCEGRRWSLSGGIRCPGIGLGITPKDVSGLSFLSEHRKRRMIGRVQCYTWNHIINKTYWSLPRDWLLSLPDNPSFVAFAIMRRVFKESNWYNWATEKHLRQNGKKSWDWLKPIQVLD